MLKVLLEKNADQREMTTAQPSEKKVHDPVIADLGTHSQLQALGL